MCYRNTRCRIRVGGELTDAFQVLGGLKQGCPLSTLLFNLVLEWIMRQTPATTGLRLGEVNCDRLAYADDVDLCGRDLQELENCLRIFKETSATIGLNISEEKTKLMKVSRRGEEEGYTPFVDMNLEKVTEFKYLGSLVTSENKVVEEIKGRVGAGSRCLCSMNKMFRSRNLSRKLN